MVVVSNRQPYSHVRGWDGRPRLERSMGGVTAALDPVLRQRGGVWIAWGSGGADREATGRDGEVKLDAGPAGSAGSYRLRRIWLTAEEVAGYYNGFANEGLWPICHLMPERVRYREAYWDAYCAVNRRFAAAAADVAATRGLVWLHDYHLGLAGAMLRKVRADLQVGLFWHIPWPPPAVLELLPHWRDIVEGLLACDLVGFQAWKHRQAFLASAERIPGASVDPNRGWIRFRGHLCRTQVFPISIDTTHFRRLAQRPSGQRWLALMEKRLGLRGQIVAIGVDRVDYSKGLLAKLDALQVFFERFPEYRGRLTLLQVAVPSRLEVPDYAQLYRAWQDRVERLNAAFGRRGWRPVRWLQEPLAASQLAPLYRRASLALVTPLQDGMNLVAKEFVACQGGLENPGVLLLSETTGAAEELRGHLSINPLDSEGMAVAMARALTMPPWERRMRLHQLSARLQRHDIYDWAREFLAALAASRAVAAQAALQTARPLLAGRQDAG